jgi:type IV pilus assembly protein PilE
MITVVIIAIIAAIALPAYNDYVTRGKIQEATSALLAMRTKMEQYYQDARTWAPAPPTIAPCQAGSVAPLPTGLKYFTITCSGLTATTYKVTATGAGFVFSIDEANTRRTENVPSGWTLPASNCWVSRKGGIC